MNKILPIVVLYKQKILESQSVNSLLKNDVDKQITAIYIHDNSPDEHDESLRDYLDVNIFYNKDYSNSGVSAAYNNGLRKAAQLGFTHVLLLDQDSTLPENALHVYNRALQENPDIKLFAPILITKSGKHCSPLLYKYHRGFTIQDLPAGINSLEKYSPINSGMMVDVNAALKCGGYDEKVYLDFSDFQFIERFNRENKFFYVLPLKLIQDFSGEEVDVDKLLVRFGIYCSCAKACNRQSLYDDFIYFMMVLARASKLVIKTRKLTFMKCFYKKYVRG